MLEVQLQLRFAVVTRAAQLRKLVVPHDGRIGALRQRKTGLPVQRQAAAPAVMRNGKGFALGQENTTDPIQFSESVDRLPRNVTTHAQLDDTRYDGRIPAVLDAQQLLARFQAQVARIVAGTLQQEAMLTRVHRFRLFHHAEHRLVDFVGNGRLAEALDVELDGKGTNRSKC